MDLLTNLKSAAKKAKRSAVRQAEHAVSRTLGGRLYYSLNGAFSTEQRAVHAGTRIHYLGESSHESRMFLRRSVHRIEKGLISRPLRQSFAADYVGDTVRTYARLAAGNDIDAGELQWSKDVLSRYFKATSESRDPSVIAAREDWQRLEHRPGIRAVELAPFPQPPLEDLASLQKSLFTLAQHRRSVRWYSDTEVPKDLVDQAVQIGLTAPSACNRQSYRVVLIRDQETKLKAAKVPMGTAGFADQIPVLAVIVGQHRGYEHSRDRHAIYVDGGLFAAQFVLALEALGLNSCCINWPDLAGKEAELKSIIPMDEDERPVMLVALGYGEENQLVPRSHKRDIDIVRTWM